LTISVIPYRDCDGKLHHAAVKALISEIMQTTLGRTALDPASAAVKDIA
jgi:hypothetical protein